MSRERRRLFLLAAGLLPLLGACSGETAAKETGSGADAPLPQPAATVQEAGKRLDTLARELADLQARLDQQGEQAEQALRDEASALGARLEELGGQVEQWRDAGEQAAGDLAGQVGDGLEQLAADLRSLDEQLSGEVPAAGDG